MRDLLQILFFLLVVKPFMTLFIGLRVSGRENLPTRDPFVLIANHSSHLDTVSLLHLFPLGRLRRIRPVAAADYFERSRAVSRLTRTCFNILPIARQHIRQDHHPIEAMRQALLRGESLILFPEGTRGAGPEPGRFMPGIAHLAEQAPDVPIVPAYLTNMGRSLPKGEYIPVPFFCEVRLGPPVRPSETRDETLARLETAVLSLKDGA
jgi:1-acyl-sn-glycerol-3-phosphate acyltransferase